MFTLGQLNVNTNVISHYHHISSQKRQHRNAVSCALLLLRIEGDCPLEAGERLAPPLLPSEIESLALSGPGRFGDRLSWPGRRRRSAPCAGTRITMSDEAKAAKREGVYPARKGHEITDDVMDGPQSAILGRNEKQAPKGGARARGGILTCELSVR